MAAKSFAWSGKGNKNMSRIGKAIINVPAGVSAEFKDGVISVKGPKGELAQAVDKGIQVKVEQGKISVQRTSDEKRFRAMHGLYRSLISNMVKGVSSLFTKDLEITGVGYRAAKDGKKLSLSMGYSHPIIIEPPAGIEFVVEGQAKVKVVGADRHLVGQVASDIKNVRPVEPYKGKGIRYSGQYVRRKAGKAAAKAGA